MRIKLKNFYIFSGCFLLILSIFLIFPNSANATGWATNALINGFGWIIYAIVFTIGWFTSFLLGWLFQVASYSSFINVDTVTTGWVIVRDLCNMFFILILLVVAFATILRIESYQWKKILPKLLIMAVLINFSRTICGLIIDFSQVIMLTFVNGIGNGAANLTSLLGMDKMMAFNKSGKAGDLGLETVAGLILALLSALVVLVVVVIMIAILVMRVIMIWIYVILSPIAFLAAAFPAGQKYSTQWWSEFTKQVISGPVLAFFLWLALVTAQTASTSLGLESITAAGLKDGIITSLLAGPTFQKYIITMGLLVGGLIITQQIGGIAGSLAGKGMGWIKGMASMPVGVGKAVGELGLKGAKELGSFGLDWASLKTKGKVDFNVFRTWDRIKDQFAKDKKARSDKITLQTSEEAVAGGRLAMVTHGGLALQNWKGVKGFFMGKERNQYGDKAHELTEQRKNIMSQDEYYKKLAKKEEQAQNYVDDQSRLTREKEEETDPEKKKKLGEELEKTEKQYNSFVENDLAPFRDKQGITVQDNEKVAKLDKEIQENINLDEKYRVKGSESVNESKAKTLADQEKKIADIDNSARLGQILQSELKEGNHASVEIIARKMTKQGDYSELCRLMKVGTGTKGMQALAKKFEKSGMSAQASRGLIAEMGGMCAKLGQFGGFYAMKMDKTGRWQETGEDEAQAAQLALMKKMPAQTFSRTVGGLGIGFYDDPSGKGIQDKSTYHLSKAAIAHLSSSQENLGEEYGKNGIAEALEHLNSHIKQLKDNKIDDTKLIKAIRNYKSNVDNESRVKSVKS